MSETKAKHGQEIVAVSGEDILANLSIEALEERLEMQIIAIPDEEGLDCGCKGCHASCHSYSAPPPPIDPS